MLETDENFASASLGQLIRGGISFIEPICGLILFSAQEENIRISQWIGPE